MGFRNSIHNAKHLTVNYNKKIYIPETDKQFVVIMDIDVIIDNINS